MVESNADDVHVCEQAHGRKSWEYSERRLWANYRGWRAVVGQDTGSCDKRTAEVTDRAVD